MTDVIAKMARGICTAHIDGDRTRCPFCFDEPECDWGGCVVHAQAAASILLQEMMSSKHNADFEYSGTLFDAFIVQFAKAHSISLNDTPEGMIDGR